MSEEPKPADAAKAFELLSRVRRGGEVTVRDDQQDFAALLDGAKIGRQKGGRFRLVDTGRFNLYELEWLVESGADLYTSDETRPNSGEIGWLAKAAVRGAAIIAHFHYGSSLQDAAEMAQSGAFVHLTNRGQERDAAELADLAYVCRQSGSWLVYYHRGPLTSGLQAVAWNGGWIHLADDRLSVPDELSLVLDMARDAAAAGSNVVLHVERRMLPSALADVLMTGAIVLFLTPSDYKSPLRKLERQAARRPLDFRAYYLTSTLLP